MLESNEASTWSWNDDEDEDNEDDSRITHIYSLVVIIKLSNFGGHFPNLPPLQPVSSVQDLPVNKQEVPRGGVCIQADAVLSCILDVIVILNWPVLLLELPQFSVDIKRPSKVGLPLLVSILRQVSAPTTPPNARKWRIHLENQMCWFPKHLWARFHWKHHKSNIRSVETSIKINESTRVGLTWIHAFKTAIWWSPRCEQTRDLCSKRMGWVLIDAEEKRKWKHGQDVLGLPSTPQADQSRANKKHNYKVQPTPFQ